MAKDFKKPIICPNCHEMLTIVSVKVSKVFEWMADDEEEGKGQYEDNGQGATEVFCYNCGELIGYYDANQEWGIFPEDMNGNG